MIFDSYCITDRTLNQKALSKENPFNKEILEVKPKFVFDTVICTPRNFITSVDPKDIVKPGSVSDVDLAEKMKEN